MATEVKLSECKILKSGNYYSELLYDHPFSTQILLVQPINQDDDRPYYIMLQPGKEYYDLTNGNDIFLSDDTLFWPEFWPEEEGVLYKRLEIGAIEKFDYGKYGKKEYNLILQPILHEESDEIAVSELMFWTAMQFECNGKKVKIDVPKGRNIKARLKKLTSELEDKKILFCEDEENSCFFLLDELDI